MSEQQLTACPTCGIEFGVPVHYDKCRCEDGKDFYCPNGHALHMRKPEVQALREQVADLTKMRAAETAAYERGVDWWREKVNSRNRQITSLRGQITRYRERLGLPKARRRT